MDQMVDESIWNESTKSFIAEIKDLPETQKKNRMKRRLADDTLFFAEYFFRHHCRRPFSAFHLDLLRMHTNLTPGDLSKRMGRRLAIAAPRGAAKTTLISLILLLHDILYSRERYVIILSATLKQATRRLRNLRAELIGNADLRWMYGDELAKRGEFRSQSLEINGVQVDAFGSGAEIRGLSHGPWRPTKILLDDVEDSEAVESAAQREKLSDWFHEVVDNLGDTYTHILAIGTLLHPESLLARLLARPDFDGRRYASIESFSARPDLWAEWQRIYVDLANPRRVARARRFFNRHRDAMLQDTRVLWSEKEDYYDLMVQQVTRGRRAFYQEKQNEPLSAASAVFDAEAVRRFARLGPELRVYLPRGSSHGSDPASADGVPSCSSLAGESSERVVAMESLRVVGFLDPALGRGSGERRGRGVAGDFAALAVVGIDPAGGLFLLELWVKRASPTEQIRAAFDMHERWSFAAFGVEGNCFQELLRFPLEAEGKRRRSEGRPADLPVIMVTHRRNKIERIAALEPLLANGWLAVSDSLPEEFWRELQGFPGADHDDALDAVEGAVALARQGARTGIRSTTRSAESDRGPGGRKGSGGGFREF
jgi:predicted phage terminase large subunit-like protein